MNNTLVQRPKGHKIQKQKYEKEYEDLKTEYYKDHEEIRTHLLNNLNTLPNYHAQVIKVIYNFY